VNVFVKLGPDAKVPEKSKLDAGWDVWSSDDALCKAGRVTRVSTGVFIDMSAAWSPSDPCCAFVKTRSSYASGGLVVVGGVIDPSYRGEIVVLLLNTTDKDVMLPQGEKVAQLTFIKLVPVVMEVTGRLTDTDRGVKAFGSTGQAPPVDNTPKDEPPNPEIVAGASEAADAVDDE
jgi:dUTP pyrophosphatase